MLQPAKFTRTQQIARYLYTALWLILLPILLLIWLVNLCRCSREQARESLSRFGLLGKNSPACDIWLHCASVGEVMAVQQFIHRLWQIKPDWVIAISTNTLTGRDRVKQLFAGRVRHFYLPYDFPLILRRALSILQPRMMLITEMELWPNLVHCCWESRCPVYVINGRMSEKSTRTYLKLSWLSQPLLAKLSGIAVQGERDLQNYRRLGVSERQLSLTNNMKFDLQISESERALGTEIQQQFDLQQRSLLVAGSTHDPEEKLLLSAYRSLVKYDQSLLLVLVPRHPQRFAEVKELLKKQAVKTVSFSEKAPCHADTQVLLADEMGILRALYGLATITFVGGSIAERGGHNALEPAALGKPILMGTSIYNNPQICEALAQAGGLMYVQNEQDITRQALLWLQDQAARLEAGQAAFHTVLNNRGAIDNTLRCLGLLPPQAG